MRHPRALPSRVRAAGTALAVAAALLLLAAGLAPGLLAPVAAQSDDSIIGVYTVSIGRPDVPTDLPGRAALFGLWTITFNADGSYVVARQDVGPVNRGAYEVSGDALTINDWQGLIGCGGPVAADPAAVYTWERNGDRLTLEAVDDPCADRRLLLTTREFGSFEACTTAPLPGFDSFANAPAAATPVASANNNNVGAQEGLPADDDATAAIDALLAQATGCWATGDPGRFLALHTEQALEDLAAFGPLPDFATQLRLFMTTPLEFRRIGEITLTDPDHAWAYVEVTLGGEALPQRLDFAVEDGEWLFDAFFLLGPAESDPATDAGAAGEGA